MVRDFHAQGVKQLDIGFGLGLRAARWLSLDGLMRCREDNLESRVLGDLRRFMGEADEYPTHFPASFCEKMEKALGEDDLREEGCRIYTEMDEVTGRMEGVVHIPSLLLQGLCRGLSDVAREVERKLDASRASRFTDEIDWGDEEAETVDGA